MGRPRETCRPALAAIATLLFAAMFSRLTIDRGWDPVIVDNLRSLAWCYWIPFATAWLMLGWLNGAVPKGSKRSWLIILGIALAARIVVVFGSSPQLSDDIWRYIHDGATLAQGGNPYARAPAEVAVGQAPLPGVLDRINHSELVTIYQPTSQCFFAVLALAHQVLGGEWDPLADRTFRLGFVLVDLLVIALLLCLLHGQGRSPWLACLYAWHPLTISEIAGSGHQDVLGLLLLLAALTCLQGTPARAAVTGALFAAALAVKPVVAPLALPLVWSQRHHWRRIAAGTVGGILATVALYGPFLLMSGGMGRLVDTANTFVTTWASNASLHALLMAVLGSRSGADVAAMAILCIVLGVILTRWRDDPWRASLWYLLAALLLASTAHPWYLLWVLALVPLRFHRAAWWWSFTISFSYIVLRDVAAWEQPTWVTLVEYVPVYVALTVELWRGSRPAGHGCNSSSC